LILRKISRIGAIRCQILRLKCTKFDFRWGSAQTPLGEHTALPHAGPLAVFKWSTSKGRNGKKRRDSGKGRGGIDEKGRGGYESGREGIIAPSPQLGSLDPPVGMWTRDEGLGVRRRKIEVLVSHG